MFELIRSCFTETQDSKDERNFFCLRLCSTSKMTDAFANSILGFCAFLIRIFNLKNFTGTSLNKENVPVNHKSNFKILHTTKDFIYILHETMRSVPEQTNSIPFGQHFKCLKTFFPAIDVSTCCG